MSEIKSSNDAETPGGAPALTPDCSPTPGSPAYPDFSYPNDFPAFEDVLLEYSLHNPEYKNINGVRTKHLLRQVFLDDRDQLQGARKIKANCELTRVRVFYILQQLKDSESWQNSLAGKDRDADRVAASDKEFRESPRTFLKTVQEILTQPTERLATARDDERIKSNDLAEIIIDPNLITPKLLEGLGLEHHIPAKNVKISRAAKFAHMARAIPEIKEMLGSTEPMSLPYDWHESQANYFRLMRIDAGKNKGYVLGTQVIGGKKKLFKTDLHGAYRRLIHIMQESYREEIRVLARIQSIIREIHRNLGEWPMTKSDIVKTREALMDCVDELKHVKNKHKAEMRDKIANAVSLKSERVLPAKYKKTADGSVRLTREEVKISAYNPGAKRAILVTIPAYIEKRKAEIRAIGQHLEKDRIIGDDYVSQQQMPFERFYATVEEMYPKLRLLDLDSQLAPDEKMKILANLRSLKRQCNPKDSSSRSLPLMEPYLSFGKKMAEHIDMTIEALESSFENESKHEAAIEFMKIYLISKIQHFYIHLQKVYEKHLSPKDLCNFEDLSADLSMLRSLIEEKRVTAGMTLAGEKERILLKIPEYDQVYHRIYDLLAELQGMAFAAHNIGSKAQKKENAEDAVKDQRRIRVEMKNMIKSFRFDQLVTPA